jgi:hypothetical protein
MPKRTEKARTDPELERQLKAAAADGSPVQAVVVLRSGRAGPLAPDEVDAQAREVLGRVESQVGRGAADVNVFKNMSSLVVSAEPAFIEALVQQPEVESAVANSRTDEGSAAAAAGD